jgi:hypothetical protein
MRKLSTILLALFPLWSQVACSSHSGAGGTGGNAAVDGDAHDTGLAPATDSSAGGTAAVVEADSDGAAGAEVDAADGGAGGVLVDGASAGGGGAGGSAIDGGDFDAGVDAPAGPDIDAQSIDLSTVSNSPDYIIVAADGLAASAQRYRDFRKAGGFNVDLAMVGDIVGNAADVDTASARIRDYVKARYQARDASRPMYLLLLGDAQSTWPGDRTGVPAGSWQPSSSFATLASDNVYADMDGDDVPDLAVGRITADTDAEADLVRAKVAAYEATREIGVWDRRLSVFASTSGMGDLVDTVIESVVYDITEAIPYAYDVTMTYARQTSPYVYVPAEFSDQVYRRINEGALLVAYVGHGSVGGFAKLDWNGGSFPILDTTHLEKLSVTHKSPILLFVACSTGSFVGAESVSERILVRDDAPTAIMSSTEISDPYANAIFIYEVSQAFTSARAARVGDAFMRAKQRMLSNMDSVRLRIEIIGALLDDAGARDSLKHSHLHMYTLFGDPGMAMAYPGIAQVSVGPSTASAGSEVTVTASLSGPAAGAEALVTLESPRQVILGQIASVPADSDPNRDSVIIKNYEVANDKVAARVAASPTGTSLSTKLTIPASLPAGQYHIKVFVHDDRQDYAGSAPLTVN